MFKYRSADDCSQRLRHSVIVHDGRPLYVTRVRSETVVEGTDLLTRESKDIQLVASSVAPPRLGYVNYNGRSFFICRKPVRRVRQGLCVDNLYCLDGDYIGALLTTTSFGEMLLNTYPSLAECVNRIMKEGRNSVAFSRLFCLKSPSRDNKTIGLYYKGNRVGKVLVDTHEIQLDQGHECLKEVLNAST